MNGPEVWFSPAGLPAALVPTAFDPLPLDDLLDGWYADFPGQREPQRYVMHGPYGMVLDDFVVHPVGGWSWYDAASDTLIRNGWSPPAPTAEELAECEHGLSLRLCAGPMHYPDDY